MKVTTAHAIREELDFAERAAKAFANRDSMWSYSDAEIAPGCLLALRWGAADDCVLVLRLDEYKVPVIYGQAIADAKHEEVAS